MKRKSFLGILLLMNAMAFIGLEANQNVQTSSVRQKKGKPTKVISNPNRRRDNALEKSKKKNLGAQKEKKNRNLNPNKKYQKVKHEKKLQKK